MFLVKCLQNLKAIVTFLRSIARHIEVTTIATHIIAKVHTIAAVVTTHHIVARVLVIVGCYLSPSTIAVTNIVAARPFISFKTIQPNVIVVAVSIATIQVASKITTSFF